LPTSLLQPPLYGVHQLGEVGKAIKTRVAAHDLYGAVRSMLSESVEPNLSTSVPSFSPMWYLGQPSFNTRPFSNLEPGVRHCEEWRAFQPFSLFRFYGTPKNGVSLPPNAE
jgi:hypothetical protein